MAIRNSSLIFSQLVPFSLTAVFCLLLQVSCVSAVMLVSFMYGLKTRRCKLRCFMEIRNSSLIFSQLVPFSLTAVFCLLLQVSCVSAVMLVVIHARIEDNCDVSCVVSWKFETVR